MAGEIEEPYSSISFQSGSLHSGSISFGRFENEDLSWERRSSFSHNKYLEEVERYSKPGSVTEKKAYFEAHFKKKGMQMPDGSLDGHIWGEYHGGENDDFENADHNDEDYMHGTSNHDQFDDGVMENEVYVEFDVGYEGGHFDHENYKSSQCDHFDGSPESLEDHGERDMMECEKEDMGATSESHMGATLSSADVLSEGTVENNRPQGLHETVTRSGDVVTPEEEREENFEGGVANAYESASFADPSPQSEAAENDKTASVNQHALSPKLEAVCQNKSTKPSLKSQGYTSKVQIGNHNDTSKADLKKQSRRESLLRVKSERQVPRAATPTRRLVPRTPKAEDSESCTSRSSLTKKSEKDQKLKKAVESQASGPQKVEPRVRHSTNRLKQTVTPAKLDARTSTPAFSFRSSERAERRKEYYTKLGEKMHAKEAEMTQIQAKTQEKTEAEIRQFRKSLNFKATPMPSFYNSSPSPCSTGTKATSSKTKAAKIQPKLSSPGKGPSTRSPMFSKAGNSHSVIPGEPGKRASPPESDGKTNSHATEFSEGSETLPKNNRSHPGTGMKNGVSGKEYEKAKDTNSQRYKATDASKASKDQKTEGKSKIGNRRNSSEMVRKSLKSSGISNSGMGRLAVGVAS